MSSSNFPGFSQLFVINDNDSSRQFVADIELGGANATAVLRGTEAPKQPQARWAMGGKKPGQFVFTTYVSVMMLGADMVSSLQEAGISGWSTFPVELFGKRGEPFGTYYGLVVHGRCGALDKSRSVRTTQQLPGGVLPIWRGLFFDEDSWDRSDIFMPADKTAWVFVTARAKQIFAARAKNLEFEPLVEVDGLEV